MRFHTVVAATCLMATVVFAPVVFAQSEGPRPADGRGNHSRWNLSPAAAVAAQAGTNGINYHNGPVMLGTTHLYYIWYGNWSTDATAANILNNFANHIGGSPYFNINTTYTDGSSSAVANSVILAGSVSDSSPQTALSDTDIWNAVKRGFTNGLPVDPNGVYFVLTAPGVTATSGFLTQYCGWHTYNVYNGVAVKYVFVGNAKGAGLGACATQTAQSPNNDPAADGMVSVIAHELEETVSDPQLTASYDSNGGENADKCAWTWGTTYATSNGSWANMKLGALDYLIQRNWLNANGGSCALSYASSPPVLPANFSLSASPASQSVVQGSVSANYTITVAKTGGFNSAVGFQVSGLPAGATLKTSPLASATAATFSINVPLAVVAGSYPITITGTGGTLTHTAAATLVVTMAKLFTVSLTPSALTLTRGASVRFSATIVNVKGFTSPVKLSVSGVPVGASATIAGGTIMIYTSATTPKATTSFTVTGTSGATTASTTASLTVR